MVERYVFVKLEKGHDTPRVRRLLAEGGRRALAAVPGVIEVRVGTPADEGAERAWDLSLAVRFARREDVDVYLVDPGHRAWVEQELAPRTAVKKAWTFDLT